MLNNGLASVLIPVVLVALASAGCAPGFDCRLQIRPEPFHLLGPFLGGMLLNVRGVYLAEVKSVVRAVPVPLVAQPGTFGRLKALEVLYEVEPGSPDEDVPRQSPGDEIDVLITHGAYECRGPDRSLLIGDRIIIFLWRARGEIAPSGQPVPHASLFHSVLCVDSEDMVHIADHLNTEGIQEEGVVPLGQFRDALSRPWGSNGLPLRLPDGGFVSGSDHRSIKERCQATQCRSNEECFFGAGCWTVTRNGPDPGGCFQGDFFSDGTECQNSAARLACQ